MALAFRFSARQRLCSQEDAQRVTRHLKAVGLPYDLTSSHVSANGEKLVAHMMHDKKMEGGKLPLLLARGIGQTFLVKDVDKIGRAHVCTPVTNVHLVCRLLHDNKQQQLSTT